MVSDIVKGIAKALNDVFNAETHSYEIYNENVNQGLVEPCFSIKHIDTVVVPYADGRRQNRNSFDITYFPQKNSRVDMLEKALSMLNIFYMIELLNGDKMLGRDMSYEIVDDALHFTVNFNDIITIVKDEDAMETLTIEGGIEVE